MCPMCEELVALFTEYRWDLGHDSLERACEYEDQFCEIICKYEGHKVVIQDLPHRPAYDRCDVCDKRFDDIERSGDKVKSNERELD